MYSRAPLGIRLGLILHLKLPLCLDSAPLPPTPPPIGPATQCWVSVAANLSEPLYPNPWLRAYWENPASQCISGQVLWEVLQQLRASEIASPRSNELILHMKILSKVLSYVSNCIMFSLYNRLSEQALRKLSQHHFILLLLIGSLNDIVCGPSEWETGVVPIETGCLNLHGKLFLALL